MDQLPILTPHKPQPKLLGEYQKLQKQQASGTIDLFGKMWFDSKILILGLALSAGLFSAANAWRGEASDRVKFCIETPGNGVSCKDDDHRTYLMTSWHWEAWEREGKNSKVKFEEYIPSSNPYKPFWALGAFGSFALASWMLRHMQDNEALLQEYQSIKRQRDKAEASMQAQLSLMDWKRKVSIAEVELQAEIEMIAGDHSTVLRQAEILAEAEVEIAKLNAQDAIFDAETAGMTDEQKREYIAIRNAPAIAVQANQITGADAQEAEAPVCIADNGDTQVVSEVMKRVATEDGSTALCGDPGTGKSTITREYIRQVRVNCPDANIVVLAVKNDSFCGLNKLGKVTRFVGDDAIANASNFFNGIKSVYEMRINAPESDRGGFPPFVIILDDWLTIAAKLNKVKDLDFDFGEILFNILIIGREYNMKFFVNLHSLNLAAIGIQELDQNTRKCLRLLLLGNRYQKDGRSLDAYGVIEQAITGAQVITHAKDKELVREDYSRLKQLSRAQYQPVMFAFIGGYYIGIVPRFPPESDLFPSHGQPTPVEVPKPPTPELSLTEQLDAILGSQDKPTLSDRAAKVLEIIQSGTEPVGFEAIRKSRKWEENPSTEVIREALNELTIKECISGDRSTGYSIVR